MTSLQDIVRYCNERLNLEGIEDYPGAANGLQFENDGHVRRLGAAVDAGMESFGKAARAGVDLLLVHHGMFWRKPYPVCGMRYQKYRFLVESNLAVYSAHLPLDCHDELGNNACLIRKLNLETKGKFLDFKGNRIGFLAEGGISRKELKSRLAKEFPSGVTAIECGSQKPETIAVASGSGVKAVTKLERAGADTLITGEVRQHSYNQAREAGLNLYLCGHYATGNLWGQSPRHGVGRQVFPCRGSSSPPLVRFSPHKSQTS